MTYHFYLPLVLFLIPIPALCNQLVGLECNCSKIETAQLLYDVFEGWSINVILNLPWCSWLADIIFYVPLNNWCHLLTEPHCGVVIKLLKL